MSTSDRQGSAGRPASPTQAALPMDEPTAAALRPAPGVVTRDTPGVVWGADGVPRSPDGVALRTKDHRPRIVSLQVAPCYEDEDHHVVSQFTEGPNEKTQFWSVYMRDDDGAAHCLRDVELPDLNACRRFAERLAQDVADLLNERLQAEVRAARLIDPQTPEPARIYVEAHRWERTAAPELRSKQPTLDHIDTHLPPGKAERFVARAKADERHAAEHARVL